MSTSVAAPPAAHPLFDPRARFGFWSIVLLTINSIIGTGIFLSPGTVLKLAGGWTAVIYVLAGAFAAILAITFAAAAKYVTSNGASYAYTHTAFGDDVGFYVGITRYVAAAIAWGVLATAVVSSALGIFGGPAAVTTVNITIGFVVLMAVLLAINLAGTGITKWFNNISTAGKVAALVLAILAGVILVVIGGQNRAGDLSTATAAGKPLVPALDLAAVVVAVLAAFYAFTGFESAATAASEMDNPARDLPRAIPLAIGIVTAIYVGVILIVIALNPVAVLTSSDPVVLAAAFDNRLLRGVIVAGALVSMFGINVAASFNTPRVLDAMSRRGQAPAFAARLSSRDVPVASFLLTAALAVAVPAAFGYSMRGIMVISSVARFIQFLVVPAAVIAFFLGRARQPVLDAPKNRLTDVAIPAAALISSALLLAKFDWAGQFSTTGANGSSAPNWWAIGAMFVGYVILPVALYVPWKQGRYTGWPTTPTETDLRRDQAALAGIEHDR